MKNPTVYKTVQNKRCKSRRGRVRTGKFCSWREPLIEKIVESCMIYSFQHHLRSLLCKRCTSQAALTHLTRAPLLHLSPPSLMALQMALAAPGGSLRSGLGPPQQSFLVVLRLCKAGRHSRRPVSHPPRPATYQQFCMLTREILAYRGPVLPVGRAVLEGRVLGQAVPAPGGGEAGRPGQCGWEGAGGSRTWSARGTRCR